MSCEGKIEVYDAVTGQLLQTVTCPFSGICLSDQVKGEGGQPAMGVEVIVSEATGRQEPTFEAGFNSVCAQ